MELKAKVIGVEQAFDGVVLVIQQEKMKIPVAEPVDDDTARMFRKIIGSMRSVGFNLDSFPPSLQPQGFRTGIWMSLEEYTEIGKPSVGEEITLSVKWDGK